MAAERRSGPVTALILAASPRGAGDPVARLQGVSHKCLVRIAGRPMIERVVDTLLATGGFERIVVSIESEAVLRALPRCAQWLDAGVLEVLPSRANLAESITAIAEQVAEPLPLVVTTGDNALHTPELVADFLARFLAGDADVALAFTAEDVVSPAVPDSGLAFHRLRDGGFSSCNLYGIRSRKGLDSARVFRSGGQFGKRHWRILRAFGLLPFVLYKLKLATAAGLLRRIGRNLGVAVEIVMLAYPEGPIDVDGPASFHLSERLLRQREARAAQAGVVAQ